MRPALSVSVRAARRLAIVRQGLAGPAPAPDREGILDLVGRLGYLQLDPTSAVARSHLLVLWSRLGPFRRSDVEHLLYQERALFEYWCHAASIVPASDYPLHRLLMRTYPGTGTASRRWVGAWMEENHALRAHILAELAARGPLRAQDLEDRSARPWRSSGWTDGRNVPRMLEMMWMKGEVLVSRRSANARWWDLSERCLAPDTPREELSEREVVELAAQRSLRSLGVATPRDINSGFTGGRYPGLAETLDRLLAAGTVLPVGIRDGGRALAGRWLVHADDADTLQELDAGGGWHPRTTLLSPFDNLIAIADRARAERLFGFRFRLEIYLPKPNRRYGYFVMPVLHGDRLIGRIDPVFDRARGILAVKAVHPEPEAPMTHATGRAIGAAVRRLGRFLGAREIEYGEVPAAWAPAID
ncbi:MAG: winged helix-turn-helix domain-containing protein [Candidatus Dormibacteraceae bacterium]